MKERLTGAIILVVLIVLLVPELLSGPKGRATQPATGAPASSEEPPLRSYTINLGDDSHSRTAVDGGSGPAMPQPSAPDQPTSTAADIPPAATPEVPSQAAQQAPESAPPKAAAAGEAAHPQEVTPAAPMPSPPVPPHTQAKSHAQEAHTAPGAHTVTEARAAKATGWAVQLGVFASRENAERLASEVRAKGFKASVSPVTSGGRKLFRVRVGPTTDRAAAQELQAKLKAAGRPGGTVVPYS